MKLANASLALLLSQLSAAYLCDGTKFTVNWVVGSSGNPSEYMTQETGISEYAVETLGPWYMLKFKTKDGTSGMGKSYTFWTADGDSRSNMILVDGWHNEMYSSTSPNIKQVKCTD